jgi:uncharacterized protein
VLESIQSQGKLDEDVGSRYPGRRLQGQLEDIYLPYKPRRRTRRRSQGRRDWSRWSTRCSPTRPTDPSLAAVPFVAGDRGIEDVPSALNGARSILVERLAENADLIGELRNGCGRGAGWPPGTEGQETAGAKFADYFEMAEPFASVPSNRVLAMFRGEGGVLSLSFLPEEESGTGGAVPGAGEPTWYERRIAAAAGIADREGRRPLAGRGRPVDLADPDPGQTEYRPPIRLWRNAGTRRSGVRWQSP